MVITRHSSFFEDLYSCHSDLIKDMSFIMFYDSILFYRFLSNSSKIVRRYRRSRGQIVRTMRDRGLYKIRV